MCILIAMHGMGVTRKLSYVDSINVISAVILNENIINAPVLLHEVQTITYNKSNGALHAF